MVTSADNYAYSLRAHTLSTDEISKRKAIAINVLGKSLYNDVYSFFYNIFEQKPDLIVCRLRKVWCLLKVFLPFYESSLLDSIIITHDRMLLPCFNTYKFSPQDISVIIVDDTLRYGRSIDDCVRRLVFCQRVNPSNIKVSVFAVRDSENGVKIKDNQYIVGPKDGMPEVRVPWFKNGRGFCTAKDVCGFCDTFVELIHACGEPYIGYVPAFRISIKSAKNSLGNLSGTTGDYIRQKDLAAPFSDAKQYELFNTTTQHMYRRDVEAFILLPKSTNAEWFPKTSDILAFSALRIYVNRNTQHVLISPHISLKTSANTVDLANRFPNEVKYIFDMDANDLIWSDNEQQIAAHRALKYAFSYAWGRLFLKDSLSLADAHNLCINNGGIDSVEFHTWINGDSLFDDLVSIKMFLSAGNTVEDPPFPENEYERILTETVSTRPFKDVVCSFMFFRKLLDTERDMSDCGVTHNSFLGFPIQGFIKELGSVYQDASEGILNALITMLCDYGAAVTMVNERDGYIGTYLLNGEESFLAVYNISPSYARFLTNLKELMEDSTWKGDRRTLCNDMANKVKAYFNNYPERCYGVSADTMLDPLVSLRDSKSTGIDPYCSKSDLLDLSETFFSELFTEASGRMA